MGGVVRKSLQLLAAPQCDVRHEARGGHMTKPVAKALEWMERASEIHVCFFALSFVLLVDIFRNATGHPGVLAMSFESVRQVELHEWIVFGSIAVVFYALASRWLQSQLLGFLLTFPSLWRWRSEESSYPSQSRADERARNYVRLSRLRAFAVRNDNGSARALAEQEQQLFEREDEAERVRQHAAFCFLALLLLEVCLRGPLARAMWASAASREVLGIATSSALVLVALAAFSGGIIRALNWTPRLEVYLPDHGLDLPGVTPPEPPTMAPGVLGKPCPRPGATDTVRH